MDRLDNYRIFYEVAKVGNITRAAENLYISQPAISQVIKKMEEQLQAKLFIRNKSGVELTRFGQQVFQKVEIAILSIKAAENMAEEEHELLSGELIIGSGSMVAREFLLEPFERFLQSFPNIQIVQVEGVQSVMFEKLRKGEVDLIISQQNAQITDLEFYPIANQKYVFVKKKGCEIKRFIKLSKGSYTYELFEEFEREKKLKTLPDIIVTGYRMAIELAKLGVGLALIPESIAKKSLANGETEVAYEDYKLPQITFGYYINQILINRATEVFVKFLGQ